jgi:putative hydrolase of the HAD superfamily
VLEEALTATRRRGFTFVADAYHLPARVRAAWRAACGAITLRGPLAPYPDVVPALRRLDVARYLLTTGYRRLQESKIDALGIRDLFDAIYIDALDAGPTAGKEPLLRAILDEHGLAPREVLVVGDNPESEIAAANRVGTVTAQIIRPGVSYAERAEHHLITLDELPDLVHRLRT